MGVVKARGARLRNRVICIRERASAMALSVPGICCRTTVKVWLAATKNHLLTSTMSSGLLEVPEDQILTTAWLSQCTKSFLPPRHAPMPWPQLLLRKVSSTQWCDHFCVAANCREATGRPNKPCSLAFRMRL